MVEAYRRVLVGLQPVSNLHSPPCSLIMTGEFRLPGSGIGHAIQPKSRNTRWSLPIQADAALYGRCRCGTAWSNASHMPEWPNV